LVLLDTYFRSIFEQAIQRGGLPVELFGCEEAFFPVSIVQAWQKQNLSVRHRKKHLLPSLRNRTANQDIADGNI
jgi:hypothetical protein